MKLHLNTALPVSAQAYCIAQEITEGRMTQPTLWVVEHAHLAQMLHEELLSRLDVKYHANILLFPDWETLPYDRYAPHPHIITQRLSTLHRLASHTPFCVLTSASSFLYRCVSPQWIKKNVWRIHPQHDRTTCLKQLEHLYERADQLRREGQYVLRGSLIDIHPIQGAPIRLDFIDNKLDRIMLLDPHEYRALRALPYFDLIPKSEAQGSTRNEDCLNMLSYEDPAFVSRLRSSVLVPGYHYYLPYYHNDLVSLQEHLPANTRLLIHTDAWDAMRSHWSMLQARYQHHQGSPVFPPEVIAFPPEHFESLTRNETAPWAQELSGTCPLQDLLKKNESFVIAAKTHTRRLLLEQLLKNSDIPIHTQPTHQPGVSIAEYKLTQSFRIPSLSTTYLKEEQLYEHFSSKQRPSTEPPKEVLSHEHYSLGEKVVHREYGIGLLEDLVDLTTDGQTESFFKLQYAQNKIIYIPIDNLANITPYYGQEPLDDPGHQRWQQRIQRAREACEAYAAHLLSIEAQRMRTPAPSIGTDHSFKDFCKQFYFEETEDQLKCTEEILNDMAQPRPMDRLLLGDVGFGKTEVLLRSAFACIMAGYQVIMLCPTTILAEQHAQTARERMSAWPIRIALHSRLKSKKERDEATQAFLEGNVDFMIATHGILTLTQALPRLGLLIIDEEHRFGVKDKQKLIAFHPGVHRLSVSATPIPRTLQTSLQELRGISFIHTPPKHRLPVITVVSTYSDDILKEAVHREAQRGGQIFIIHNEIETQHEWSDWFKKHFPTLETTLLHANMPERIITQTMHLFLSGVYQVLISTTLVESGIDIPNANTIIVHRADRLGLAQMHQLRGRVGRSHHQGYAYFLHPPLSEKDDAYARLSALKEHAQLGSGWLLSIRDLEIRGAGSLLGSEQSGHMDHIGYACYQQLLQEAVQRQRSDTTTPQPSCSIELKCERYIPSSYLPDISARLEVYQELQNLKTLSDLDRYTYKLIYEHGSLPVPTQQLMDHTRLSILAKHAHVARIYQSQTSIVWQWHDATYLDTAQLFELARNPKSGIHFTHNLAFSVPVEAQPYLQCLSLLRTLSTHPIIRET